MKRTACYLALLLALSAMPLIAGEVAGVKMPDRISVEGKPLVLNGLGLRTKVIFKVYVAGLYAEVPSKNAAQMIASDQIRQVKMVMLRDLGRGKIAEAVEDGFESNNKAQMPALRDRLAKFIAQIPDLKSGQELLITYVPGKGTMLSSSGAVRLTVLGKDFADALFSVWLGQNPVDDGLKKAMMGL